MKKYYLEIALLCGYAIVLCVCSPMDITQMNLGDKSIGLVYEAISFDISGRSPLYSILGWIVTRLPMSDALAMSILLSILPSILSVIIVYKMIRMETNNRYYSIIGASVLMSSTIFFLQSQKIEPYCLAAFLFTLGFYFVLKKRYYVSVILFSLAIATHLSVVSLIFITFLYYPHLRKMSWMILIIPAIMYGVIFLSKPDELLYNFLIIDANMGFVSNWTILSERLWIVPASIIFTFSFGVIPIVYLLIRREDAMYTIFALYGCILLFVHIIVSVPGVNLVALAVPILSVAAGVGMKYVKFDRMVLIGCCLMFFVSVIFFNIRFNDNVNNSTSARSLINNMMLLEDGSKILNKKYYNGVIFSDGYFVQDAVEYCNYKMNKKIELISDEKIDDYYYVNVIDSKNLYSEILAKRR
jgi:hypothetical protein